MALSLPSFFSSPYAPSTRWNDFDRMLERDLMSMTRLMESDNFRHRQPTYTYDELNDSARLEIELPGVSKQNVSIDIHGDQLIIRGKRYGHSFGRSSSVEVTEEQEQEQEQPQQQPQPQKEEDKGKEETQTQPKPSVVYELKMRVGPKSDMENVRASMHGDGVLRMVIPMKESQKTRTIQIESGSS